MVAFPEKTLSSALSKSSMSTDWDMSKIYEIEWGYSRKGSKNPRVPIEKLRTGGTAPALNRDEACNMVPSPPSVTTKSIFSGLAGREHQEVPKCSGMNNNILGFQISAP